MIRMFTPYHFIPNAHMTHVSTIKCNPLGAYSLPNSLHSTFREHTHIMDYHIVIL